MQYSEGRLGNPAWRELDKTQRQVLIGRSGSQELKGKSPMGSLLNH